MLQARWESVLTNQNELAAEYEICAKQYGCDFLDAGPFVKMNQIDFMHLDAESHERLAEQIAQVIRKKV